MKLFGPKLDWIEPWSWDKVRRTIEANFKASIPLPRLVLWCVWCVIFPIAAIMATTAVLLFVVQVDPDEPSIELLGRNLIVVPLGLFGIFIVMPCMSGLFPKYICIRGHGIALNSIFVKKEYLVSLRFQTIDGKRFFAVGIATRKGQTFEWRIEMPDKKVTEQDVVKFLYDQGLSHLYRTDVPETPKATVH